jgi:FlaA1/EpsC-like NDP-sugar epimerase
LYEELLIGDNPTPTAHPRIMKARESFLAWNELQPRLTELESCIQRNDAEGTLGILRRLVAGYQPAPGNVDWVAGAASQ